MCRGVHFPARLLSLDRLDSIAFGKTLGAGAFGTVKQATVTLNDQTVPVAVKTLTFTSSNDFEEHLEEFMTEASIGWELGARSRENVKPIANPSDIPTSCN